jgi:hypothetical protein
MSSKRVSFFLRFLLTTTLLAAASSAQSQSKAAAASPAGASTLPLSPSNWTLAARLRGEAHRINSA